MGKVMLITVLILLGVLAAAVVGGGIYLVHFSLNRTVVIRNIVPESQTTQENQRLVHQSYEREEESVREWMNAQPPERVEVLSRDGLHLRGEYFASPENRHLWLIAIHGYRADHQHMRPISLRYARAGYHVLLPDLRGCGASEGKWIGMGWLDRRDMLRWIDWILERDPEAQIVLHGVSMGGATAMMTSGEELPPQVRAVVEDCGYTSVWDIFADEMKGIFHLPSFPILNAASVFSSMMAGYSFTEASCLEQVRKARVPILFIHGQKDNFVHTAMVYRLYEACRSEKQLLVVEGAGHGESQFLEPDLYFSTVFDFLGRFTGDT